MADLEQIIFGKKKYSDILQDIYTRNAKKEQELIGLITQLRGLISNVTDAVMMVPLIAEYMNMSIKNDDNLIKMAAIVQKVLDRGEETGDFMFSEDEKAKLIEEAEKLHTGLIEATVKKKA